MCDVELDQTAVIKYHVPIWVFCLIFFTEILYVAICLNAIEYKMAGLVSVYGWCTGVAGVWFGTMQANWGM